MNSDHQPKQSPILPFSIPFISLVSVLVWIFWPILSQYPAAVIPSKYPDALEFIWSSWRIEGVLGGKKELYQTHELFWPHGASLLLHTISEGILVPVGVVFGQLSPPWQFNVACFILLILNALSAVSFLRAFCLPFSAVYAGSFALTFNPFILGHLHAGHLNFLPLFPLLELLRWHIRLIPNETEGDAVGRDRIAISDYIRVIASIAILPFLNLYYLYFAAGLEAFFLCGQSILIWRAASTGEFWKIVFRIFAAEVVIWFIALTPALPHLMDIASLALSGTYTHDHNARRHAADLLSYVIPSAPSEVGRLGIFERYRSYVPLHSGESSIFLGWSVILGVFIAGLRQRDRITTLLCILGIGSMLLSLGPVATFGGHALAPTWYDSLLRRIAPLYPSVPIRFAVIASLVFVPVALRTLYSQSRIVVAIATACMLVEFWPHQLEPFHPGEESSALIALRDASAINTVYDAGLMPQTGMYRQTFHGKPMAGGFLSRRPRGEERTMRRNAFIQWMYEIRERSSIGAAPNETSEEQGSIPPDVRQGWCNLGVDAVIVELRDSAFREYLAHRSAFTSFAKDDQIEIFSPAGTMCTGEEQ